MTRGRHANHVHLTADPADDDAHRPRPAGAGPTLDDAVRALQTATARAGAQQAAHTLLDYARQRASSTAAARPRDPSPWRRTLAQQRGPWASATDRSRHWSSPDAAVQQPNQSIGM
jgi:hypothetical protein